MFRKLIYIVSFVLVPWSATGLANADITTGLLVYWPLNEEAGSIVLDATGNGHDGTFNGNPQWVDGKHGSALHFDGVDDFVTHSLPGDQTYAAFTVAVWVKADSISQADLAGIFSSRFPGGATGAGFQIDVAAATQVYQVRPNSGNGVFGNATTDWVHLAMVCEGTSAQLYYQGVPTNKTNLVSSLINEFTVGVNRARSRFFAGTIDELRVYDHSLSEVEILTVMEGEPWPYAFGPDPRDGAMLEATWAYLSWAPGDMAVTHDVYFGESFDDVNAGTGQTFLGSQTAASLLIGLPGGPYPEGLVPGTTYYWRIDEVNKADPNSPWKGDIWSFSVAPKTAYNPEPADGAQFVGLDNVTLSWTPGFGAKLHTVYFGDNFDTVANAAGGLPQGAATYKPASIQSEKVYYWRVDEFDGAATHKGNIWAFTTPGAAGNPQPANGAAGVQMVTKLSWTPATNATSHDVYFGTDKDAVRNATTASPEYKGSKAKGSESYDPGKLAWCTPYYWRVDAVYNTGTVKGLIWSFTTADFITVDDFESYNDIDPPDPVSNRIFDKWIDGFATPTTNGALIGNDLPPYAERTIVHSGIQSMPYSYDNANKTSEATLTLIYPRDWTEEGVAKLSLWFRGAAANAAERMYVALNGGTPVYHTDPKAAQAARWTEWVIDLQAFQGVILTNVNTITIGFGTKGSPAAGGAGKVYFDDIRLYRP